MSITPTELPLVPTLEERVERAPRRTFASTNDAALEEVAQLMGKISELVKSHPEWRCQRPAERVDNILAALRRL